MKISRRLIPEKNLFQQSSVWNVHLAFLSFIGFLAFLQNPTAYSWGEQDMMPFLIHLFNPELLVRDFFTQASVEINPRLVYGYLVALPGLIFGGHWYTWLFFLKVCILIAFPPLIFLVVVSLLKRYISFERIYSMAPYIMACIGILVLSKDANNLLAVGNWRPYNNSLYPANLSMFISFLGIVMRERRLLHPWGFIICTAAAALIHPVMALFSSAFYVLFLLPWWKSEWKGITLLGGIVVLSGALISLFLKGDSTLDTQLFIEYYVKERHPWHYHVSAYKNEWLSWIIVFISLSLLHILPALYGYINKFRELTYTAMLGFLAYTIAIALQYVFIEVYPAKIIAYLGPSRYTTFGIWSALICWFILIGHKLRGRTLRWSIRLPNWVLFAVGINFLMIGSVYLDNPEYPPSHSRKEFFTFVRNTPLNSVFQTFSESLNTDIRIIGNRSVVVSKEFPFAESKIKEYSDRYKDIYGSRQDGIDGNAHYRELSISEWNRIASLYNLDYILVEAAYADAFQDMEPVWSNNNWRVYAIQEISNTP